MPPDTASSPAATLTAPRSLSRADVIRVPASLRMPMHPSDDREAISRFGAAAHLLDRLDTRSFEERQAQRPWWRLW